MTSKVTLSPELARHRPVRFDEVLALTGLTRPTIRDLVRKGKFPAPFRLGGRAVAWHESQIVEWVKSREPVQLKSWLPEDADKASE
jgi:prophage regulatory protein